MTPSKDAGGAGHHRAHMTTDDLDRLRLDLSRRGVRITLANTLRPRDAAGFLGKSVHTLRNWRAAGTGPPYVYSGGTVFYRLPDLVAFLEVARNHPSCNRSYRNALARQKEGGDDDTVHLPIPTSRIETQLPVAVAAAIRELAKAEGTTPAKLLEDALRDYAPISAALKSTHTPRIGNATKIS